VDEALDGPGPTAEEAELEGFGRTVLFVESKMEMQDLFREQIKKSGYRVLITSDPRRAIQRLEDDIRLAHCVIFSTQDLGADAVAAFNRLGESETVSHLPAILLLDRHRRALINAAKTNDHRIILSLPLKIGELRKKLRELIGAKQ
jgi:serine/threonine-protein kinase